MTKGPRPPALFLAAMLIQIATHFLVPIGTVVPRGLTFVGVPLIIVGFTMVTGPAKAIDRARTTIDPFGAPTVLVIEGWFLVTRNPMYLGMSMILFGAAILLGTATPFLVVPAFVRIVSRRFIRHEEATLAATFGSAYAEYSHNVRRWI